MQSLEQILSEMQCPSTTADQVLFAASCSPFLRRLVSKQGDFLEDLIRDLYKTYQTADLVDMFTVEKNCAENDFLQLLRQVRQRVVAHLIVRDLNGLADFAEVVATTTALAEQAIRAAADYYNAQLTARHGNPRDNEGKPQQLIVVGMGKLGGAELNVSSDIDLIFAYEQAGETDGDDPISNQSFFTKLGKKLIAALDEVTADGFVFRVDMRLRPFGSEGALVCDLDALEDYYQHYGREWERYAWIKGRVVYGPAQALHRLMKPFVFRKYLDFNAYAAMRDLKTQIMRDVAQRQLADNIKLGRGGIREVEFIAQLFQLIRGGQQPDLQIRPTLQVLDLLPQKGLLPREDAQVLQQSYVYLRNLEHRLMYIEDQQTQDLPRSEASRQYLLRMLNLPDWPTFFQQLADHRACVQRCFDQTFQAEASAEMATETALWQGTLGQVDALAWLKTQGYTAPEDAWQLLQHTRNSQKMQQLPESSRQRLDQLVPLLIREATQQTHTRPETALLRTLNLLEQICRRASYLALLAEFPHALSLVVKLCAASPWLAQYLAGHPLLLDELLNKQTLFKRLDRACVQQELQQKMQQHAGDTEAQMDAIRHVKHAYVLKIAAQDVMAALPLEAVSDDLSALAEVILQVSLDTVWQQLAIRHRPKPQFAIIGYGKLGGRELGYLSDLDIIFLYADDHPQAAEVYARLAQRLNTWFNTLTNAGLLYETDLQLRPDGNSGLLVSSVAAFATYQQEKAWIWEHQAITRARFIAGDAEIGQRFEQIRTAVMTLPRDAANVRKEVVAMRHKMRAAQRFSADRFDIKQQAGGIIDVEFMVQCLLLSYAATYPTLAENKGNIALLACLADIGLINPSQSNALQAAYRQYRAWLHACKLQGSEPIRPWRDCQPHPQAVIECWQAILGDR